MSKYALLENYISLRREVNLVLGQELRNFDFGQKQMVILYQLTLGPASMRSLAVDTLSDPAAISRAVGSLEKGGFVSRLMCPDDQRKFIVTLTPKGRTKAKEAEKIRAAVGDMLNATLSQRERDQFNQLLEKIIAGLHERVSP